MATQGPLATFPLPPQQPSPRPPTPRRPLRPPPPVLPTPAKMRDPALSVLRVRSIVRVRMGTLEPCARRLVRLRHFLFPLSNHEKPLCPLIDSTLPSSATNSSNWLPYLVYAIYFALLLVVFFVFGRMYPEGQNSVILSTGLSLFDCAVGCLFVWEMSTL